MLRRIGFPAMLAGMLCIGSSASRADNPLYTPGQLMDASKVVTAQHEAIPGQPDVAVQPTNYSSDCNFNPVSAWDESNVRKRHSPVSKRLRGAQTTGGGNCDDANGPCDFKAANPWGDWDFEKRFIAAFVSRNAHGGATQAAYGDSWGAQFGVEWLPWVLTDGSERYSRMGFTTLFEYANFEGGSNTTLQNRQTLNFLTIGDGVSYSFIVGPTYRVDFDFLGIRMSPSAMVGIDFEWTTLRERAPTSLNIRRIDDFKFSGFDAAFYTRLMWDYGITDNMTLGIGMDFKYVPTDVMVRSNEARKHTGFIVQLTHNF